MSPALGEQDYMGLSSASPDKLSAFSDGALGLEDTELRLGLPGSASLERGVGGLALGLAKGRFLFGGKRGFSYAIDEAVAEVGSSSPASGENAGGRASKVAPSPAAKAQVVGWPPVRSYRKNALASSRPPKNTEDAEAKPGEECLYVKVSFDGAPYLRKVDLKTYSNYKELSLALQSMFTCFTMGSEYVVTYEDRDGDWMLVGDVPWEMFADSCRRLRIMKGSDAIGIGALKEGVLQGWIPKYGCPEIYTFAVPRASRSSKGGILTAQIQMA